MSDDVEGSGARIASSARKWVTNRLGVSRFVAYRPASPVVSTDVVRRAVETANRRSQERAHDDPALGDAVVASGLEVHLQLTEGGEQATREAWLEDVAATLPAGELTRPRRDSGPESALVELLTLQTVSSFLGQRPEGDQRRLFTTLLDGMGAGARSYFAAAETGMEVDPEDLPDLFCTLRHAPHVLFVRDGLVRGDVAKSGSSAASCYVRGTWQEELGSARAALERAAPELDVGFVRKTSAYTRWGDVHLYPPDWPSGHEGLRYLLHNEWWARRLPDAHGLQLVTADHLDRANDLSSWDVTPIGDRFLVSDPNPASWYANDQPDPATLERARRDFGAMIATAAELKPRT